MPKPTGILDIAPETLDRPFTEAEKTELADVRDNLDWNSPVQREGEDQAVIDEDKKVNEEAAETEKIETDRLDAKAKEAGKTVEDIKTIEAEEQKVEDDRVEALAKEQGKTIEEIRKGESDVKANETDESKEQARLEVIAKEENITVEEVKAAEEKDQKVVENYSKDPVKLARALRKENSAYGKLKAENDKLTEFKRDYDSERAKFNEKRVAGELESQRDRLVEEYVKLNPSESEEDEGVLFERAKNKVFTSLRLKDAAVNKEVKDKADESRVALIKELPEEYKEYASEIKEVLSSEDDNVVLDKEFNVENLCFWARGKKHTPEYMKGIVEAAEKRGKEQSEIIEKKNSAVSTGSRSIQGKAPEPASDKDKKRAREMFTGKDEWTDDKKISEYMENYKANDQWD